MNNLEFRYDSFNEELGQQTEKGKRQEEQPQERYISEFQDEPQTDKVGAQPAGNRERLIEQNIKLKTQIYQLAKQMDEILSKDKAKRKRVPAAEEEDEALRSRRAELRRQQQEINTLKGRIGAVKKQLQVVYDDKGIQAKEDQLRTLRGELKSLEEERDSLAKVKQQQEKAIRELRGDDGYQEKLEELKDKLARTKEECRQLSDKLTENERTLRKHHEQLILKQSRIKDMEAKINSSKKLRPTNKITKEMVEDLEAELRELEEEKAKNEEMWTEKMRRIDAELKERKIEEEKKLAILREKEKELRLNELKIKELKKLVKSGVAPDSSKKR